MAKRTSGGVLEKEDKRPLNKKSFTELAGIFRYILPYKFTFIAGMLCLLVSSLTVLVFPYVFPYATGLLVDAATGSLNDPSITINTIAIGLLGVFFVQALFSFLRVFLFSIVSERSMADIRKDLYAKYMSLPIPFFDSRRTGELMSRVTNDVSLLHDTLSVSLAEFFRQILTLLVGTAIILIKSPKLAGFMLAVFPVLVVAAMVFGKFIRRLSKKAQDQLAEANTVVEETLQSVSMVKAFTNEKYEWNRYGRILEKVVGTSLKTSRFRGAFVSFIILAIFGGIVLVMWYGAGLVSSNEMTIGELFGFILYTTFIGASVGGLGELYAQLQRAIGSSERIREILQMEGEVDVKNAEVNRSLKIEGEIEFRDVRFRYPTREDVEVLKGINLKINPGEKIALVGHSGAGKSTISQLLVRFYKPVSGSIMVDGTDILDYNISDYRGNIAVVPQEVILFGGTIKENISYGKPDATDEEIFEAARKANALEFVNGFPDQFNTVVGERGIKLSGGQRQRIAIARAILKDPSILILDEATSSLDAESEYQVQQALEELMKGRTTVIIAHRLSTIRKVNRIYVIDGGKVVESGTHDQLAEMDNGLYQHLLKLQFDLKN
jgi:ABC transporter fused permease/ATP-binding protein